MYLWIDINNYNDSQTFFFSIDLPFTFYLLRVIEYILRSINDDDRRRRCFIFNYCFVISCFCDLQGSQCNRKKLQWQSPFIFCFCERLRQPLKQLLNDLWCTLLNLDYIYEAIHMDIILFTRDRINSWSIKCIL